MPARSFVVGDGVCILGERAKPTTRARLPKRVRPTHGLPRPKKRGVQGRSGPKPNSMPTTFANSRPKMGRIWVITSGGVKHGPTGQLAEHLAPQALRWPTRWPTPEICCFSHSTSHTTHVRRKFEIARAQFACSGMEPVTKHILMDNVM